VTDTGGAKSCGCDTTINHECDRHTIDRLEREVLDLNRQLADIEFTARVGYIAASEGPARQTLRTVMDKAKDRT
jgi:hypothetical protein